MEIDLQHILRRESEQVEWKECLADEDDGVKTLTAFANDYQNLGGGYLIVGATEGQDENGFAVVSLSGLSAAQAKKLEGKVMALCRECVTPPILPQVELLPGAASDKKVLVFIQPRTPHVHEFRSRKGPQRYWVRANNTTVEARNGVLRELLTKKGSAPPFDQQPCSQSTKEDLDVTKIASFLQRTGRPADGAVDFIDPDRKLHATVQPLVCRSSLGSEVRPRNFSILLFGREVSKFFPNAHVVCSSYHGFDRSESVAEKVEIWGDLPQQIEDTLRFIRIHNRQLMDKTDLIRPNTYKYPPNAVQEALVNSLVHRDYQSPHPVRVTVFLDRLEIYSPGALAREVSLASLRQGRTDPVWRNQSLAWFLDALQYSQAQGQGIGTILRSLKALGSPPASFESEGESFRCVLPANPLHVSKTVLDLVKELFHRWDLTSLVHTLEQAQHFQVNLSQVWEWLAVAALNGSRAPEVLLSQLGRMGADLRMGALRVARRSLEAILGIQVTDDEFWERRDLLFDRAWNLLQQTKGGEQLNQLEMAEGLVSSIILYWDAQNPPRL